MTVYWYVTLPVLLSSGFASTAELEEIKHQLEETLGREELQRQMSRARHDSECRSDGGSHRLAVTSRSDRPAL